MAKKSINDVRSIVEVSSVISTKCADCAFWGGGENFTETVNHYIKEHGYVLLHVGTETLGDEDKPYQGTVAVLGKV